MLSGHLGQCGHRSSITEPAQRLDGRVAHPLIGIVEQGEQRDKRLPSLSTPTHDALDRLQTDLTALISQLAQQRGKGNV